MRSGPHTACISSRLNSAKSKGFSVLPVAALVVAAVALHVFKVVPAPHAEEQVHDVADKILAPLVHVRHFAQYCVNEARSHRVEAVCSSCGKLKHRLFTLFIPSNFHGLLQ